jgi:hypothetical protein
MPSDYLTISQTAAREPIAINDEIQKTVAGYPQKSFRLMPGISFQRGKPDLFIRFGGSAAAPVTAIRPLKYYSIPIDD